MVSNHGEVILMTNVELLALLIGIASLALMIYFGIKHSDEEKPLSRLRLFRGSSMFGSA